MDDPTKPIGPTTAGMIAKTKAQEEEYRVLTDTEERKGRLLVVSSDWYEAEIEWWSGIVKRYLSAEDYREFWHSRQQHLADGDHEFRDATFTMRRGWVVKDPE